MGDDCLREPLTRLDRIIRNERYQEALSQIDAAEQNRKFCRHTPEHFFDTARIMYIIALEEHLSVSKEMIYAAALLHDIGRAEEYRSRMPHEQASAQLLLMQSSPTETNRLSVKVNLPCCCIVRISFHADAFPARHMRNVIGVKAEKIILLFIEVQNYEHRQPTV